MADREVRFCTTEDNVRIAYSVEGEGPPLVRALGWFSHLEFEMQSPVWRHFMGGLSRSHQFVRYDGRGSGLSDREPGERSLDTYLADLSAVIEALRLRQFALTGGRARPEADLPLETPITTEMSWHPGTVTLPEHLAILQHCAYPQTVADLSSALDTPVGVVRVLVLDLAEAGAVTVHWARVDTVEPHRDLALLEETLRGISHL